MARSMVAILGGVLLCVTGRRGDTGKRAASVRRPEVQHVSLGCRER